MPGNRCRAGEFFSAQPLYLQNRQRRSEVSEQQRRVVAWVTISMDGYTSGPGGPAQDTWLYEHVRRASAAAHFEGIWRGASTVVVGRTNYEGFFSVWPAITA